MSSIRIGLDFCNVETKNNEYGEVVCQLGGSWEPGFLCLTALSSIVYISLLSQVTTRKNCNYIFIPDDRQVGKEMDMPPVLS